MLADGATIPDVARALGGGFSQYSVRSALTAARGQLSRLRRQPANETPAPKPCSVCGASDHDGRAHSWDGRRKVRAARADVIPVVVDGDGEAPAVDKARRKLSVVDGRVRSKTISPARLTRDEQRAGQELPYPEDVERPASRGECQGMPRPCPFVSCSHHLYLDVNPETGAIKLNFPHLEVHEMAETCSLDIADRGGITLEEVGTILNLTRERIRQVEVRGLCKIKDHTGGELGLPPERHDG